MSDLSANLALPFIQSAQAQKHVTHNEALRRLDALVQLAVESRSLTVPPAAPAAPADGTRHIVPDGASGAWAGQGGRLAIWQATAWAFLDPRPGWRAMVLDEGVETVWCDGAWQPLPGFDNLPGIGVNTGADATNRLAVSAAAMLLGHEGAGHRVKVNKAAPDDTASLLFQTGWSGRAEMGTTGSDDFAIKVSADGTAWTTALSVDAASGRVPGAAVQGAATDTGAGRLARADYVYGPGSLLGPVAESGGVPTGAVIERGTNAAGEYVRFADGTQFCSAEASLDIDQASGAIYASNGVTRDFPRAFAALSTCSGSLGDTSAGWANARAVSLTQWEVAGFAPAPRMGAAVRLLAVGRWV